MGKSVISAAVCAQSSPIALDREPDSGLELLELLGGISDGRSGQGRDHPVAAVLALAAAATVAGMKGYTAIAGWVADVPPTVLADLYLRAGAVPGPPPSKTTIWRVLTDAGAEALDAAAGTWLADLAGLSVPATPGEDGSPPALTQVRLDGKAIRGARDADGKQVRLLAAMIGPDAATSVIAARPRSARGPTGSRWPPWCSAGST